MKAVQLGHSSLASSPLAYGCWRLAEAAPNPAEAPDAGKAAVIAAYEAGYTLFDHADVYGRGVCEEIFGRVLAEVGGMRECIVIASKSGIRFAGEPPAAPYRYDFSHSYIVESCERSLKRLGVETIDIYQLHRPDWLADWHEVASAFHHLREQGKVREFGVSNFRPAQLSALQLALGFPLIVNQVEISLLKLAAFEDGTIDQAQVERITPLAWSPLGGGRLFSAGEGNAARGAALGVALDEIANRHETTTGNIALSWLMKHPAGIVPILGSTNPVRIRESIAALDVRLSREEWYTLLEAARGVRLP